MTAMQLLILSQSQATTADQHSYNLQSWAKRRALPSVLMLPTFDGDANTAEAPSTVSYGSGREHRDELDGVNEGPTGVSGLGMHGCARRIYAVLKVRELSRY